MDRDQDPSPTRNQPRLLEEVHDVIRRLHYSIRTEQAYVDWIRNVVCTHADDVAGRVDVVPPRGSVVPLR